MCFVFHFLQRAAALLRHFRPSRRLCTQLSDGNTEGEKKIVQVLKDKFPGATFLQVNDISGM